MINKRVAIVSFHRADNYGAVLQNYALQQASLNLGMDASIVDLRCETIEQVYENRLISSENSNVMLMLKQFIINVLDYGKIAKHIIAFDKFRKENLHLTKSVESLNEIDGEYDVLITGSDQVWNKKIVGETYLDNYLLDTVQNIKKVSYAASCGHISNLNDLIIDKIGKLDYITVREITLAKTLCKFIKKDIEVVCDPVFLLKKEEWMAYTKHLEKRNFKYIFLYYNSPCELEIAKYIKKEKSLKIIYPYKKYKKILLGATSCYEDGPFEFVNDILNAEVVVASSFHAIAFSILLEKDFIAVLNKDADTRASDLLKFVGLESRIVLDLNDYINKQNDMKSINYTKVREKLAQWREESLNELKKMCMLE